MRFSVVIPSYNQGIYLERTLQSIYQQTSVDFDCYVADGGSNDHTVKILQAWAEQHENFRWHSRPDQGQADAVNQAIANTTGEIIAWINSDDLYYPEAFTKMAAIFQKYPDHFVIYGQADYIDAQDQPIEPYPTQAWNYEHLKDICYLCQPAVFFRRTCIQEWGCLNIELHYCLDYELWLRWGQRTAFYYVPEVLAGSRQYPNNKTLGGRLTAHAELNQMLKQNLGYVPDRHLINVARVQTEDDLNMHDHHQNLALHNRKLPPNFKFWPLFFWRLGQQYWHWQKFPSFPKLVAYFRLKSKLLIQ